MLEKIAELVCRTIFLPRIRRIEKKIGYALVFRDIPPRFINGIVPWPMTALWQSFGLDVQAGMNYWTIGKVVDGVSTRYTRAAPEYQAWLGGYVVKLPPGKSWTPEDHVTLAVADQTSWLKNHGDPHPMANVSGWRFERIGSITAGKRSGVLYKTGCMSHSDAGDRYGRSWPYFHLASLVMAGLLNTSRPTLGLTGRMMRPRKMLDRPYEPLKLPTYCAIFELESGTHAILYGNGAATLQEGEVDTLPIIEEDLLRAMKACEIVKVS